ncbi:MAG: hypothetical protein JW841_12375 [Deltaproteobacteria bacterium]|nr:hypothetical protein [Deltaproteobacteria bacterium]
MAIEVKTAKHITDKHLKGLRTLAEERQVRCFIVVCQETRPRLIDGIHVMPWRMFLDELWTNGL